MKAKMVCILLLAALSGPLVSGCSDQLDLENAATPLALGLDLDEENKFHFYTEAPVFSKQAKKKTHETSGNAYSLRQSRAKQDAQSGGAVQGRNFQVILVGKRMLLHEGWFRMLDVIYRDPRNTVTDRVIAVDGPVSELIYLDLPDHPLIGVLLRGMVDSKSSRSETSRTTAQELHRQIYENGISPSIAEVKVVNGDVQLQGTTLLNKNGKYAFTIGSQESILLDVLRKQAKPGISLSFRIPGEPKISPFETDMLSLSATKIAAKIKSSYRNNKFQFDIKIKMTVSLTEHLFPINIYKEEETLEEIMTKQMNAQFKSLIATIQHHRIDPIGLGLYARAYQYRQYKKVEDHWPDALANAEINTSVELMIGSMGPVR